MQDGGRGGRRAAAEQDVLGPVEVGVQRRLVGGAAAVAPAQGERAGRAEELPGRPHGGRGPLGGGRAVGLVVEGDREQQGPRRDAGQQLVRVGGQPVLAAGEEAQARVEPVGVAAREQLHALSGVALGAEPGGRGAEHPGAARDDGGEALVVGGGHERGLAVLRVTADDDPRRVDLPDVAQRVERAAERPGTARQGRPVGPLGRGGDGDGVHVVVALAGGDEGGGPPARLCDTTPPLVTRLGQEHGDRTRGPRGEQEPDVQHGPRGPGGAQPQQALGPVADLLGVEGGGSRRHGPEQPAPPARADRRAPAGPARRRGQPGGGAPDVGPRAQAVEVRRRLTGGRPPGVEGRAGRLRVRAAAGVGRGEGHPWVRRCNGMAPSRLPGRP